MIHTVAVVVHMLLLPQFANSMKAFFSVAETAKNVPRCFIVLYYKFYNFFDSSLENK